LKLQFWQFWKLKTKKIKMKSKCIRIVTIGAGSGIGEDFIKKISDPNDAYKIDNMSKLQKTFETAILAILET